MKVIQVHHTVGIYGIKKTVQGLFHQVTFHLAIKMNQYSQMKDMKNKILSSVNSLKDEISNLQEIVIKISPK